MKVLGASGYGAFKYVPYGAVELVSVSDYITAAQQQFDVISISVHEI